MKITRDNYEIYALDYLEGQLDPEIHQEFLSFLASNKDISDELEGFTMVTLPVEEDIVYGDKDLLYKKSNKLFGLFFLYPNLNVAAAIALLLAMSIGWMMFQNNGQNRPNLSEQMATETEVLDDSMEIQSPNQPLPLQDKSNDVAVKPIELPEVSPETDPRELNTSAASKSHSSGSQIFNPNNDGDLAHHETIKDSESKTDTEGRKLSSNAFVGEDNTAGEGDVAVSLHEENNIKLLPTMIPSRMVNLERDLTAYMVKYEDLKRHKTSFEIHIPGELLSDTWTDMSFIHLKEKLLPEFIKN
ncbi:hypothetical protein GCM10025777_00960 [Membranihabitans marinus]